MAILYSGRSARTVEAITLAARQYGLEVLPVQASKDEFPGAIDALNSAACDSVLMIPDAHVYNSPNVQRLLLWGVRQKKPVWAFSESIVKAGALAGQYSSSEVIGRQTADLVETVIDGKRPSDIGMQYPRRIGRAVNTYTARTIGLKLSDRMIGTGVTRFGD